jgi:hypothetical protein
MDAENPGPEPAYGMRGGIPAVRMQHIQNALPRSYDLRHKIPHFEDLLSGLPLRGIGFAKHRGMIGLIDGWHMINQARIALVEAEACKVFYEEVRPDPTEAKYRSRFYLDDAALRLYSSCEHLLWHTVYYWDLSLRESRWRRALRTTICFVARPLGTLQRRNWCTPRQERTPLLVRVIQAAERSTRRELRELARPLRVLRSSNDWQTCAKYRNDWVHNKTPGIVGLNGEISFGNVSKREVEHFRIMSSQTGAPVPRGKKKITFGVGRDMDELRRIVRNAYGDLLRAYESLIELMHTDYARNLAKLR